MYPRNAASPPRIAIGAIHLIADGSKVVSDALVVVRPEGGAEGAGAGTLVVGATTGIWYYTPTQAETNYTAFTITVYKTGCTTASATIITTASAVAGRTMPDAAYDAAKTAASATAVAEIAAAVAALAVLVAALTPATPINIATETTIVEGC